MPLPTNYVIVDVSGNVINVILWDGQSPYQAPDNCTIIIAGDSGVGIGWTYANGEFLAPPIPTPPLPSPSQEATIALQKGIDITSGSNPLLNGVYSLSSQSISNVNASVTYILLNGTFPGGGNVLPWADINGSMHIFPSLDVFKSFATAFANLVAQIQIYADSNGTVGSIPSNKVTIA